MASYYFMLDQTATTILHSLAVPTLPQSIPG